MNYKYKLPPITISSAQSLSDHPFRKTWTLFYTFMELQFTSKVGNNPWNKDPIIEYLQFNLYICPKESIECVHILFDVALTYF